MFRRTAQLATPFVATVLLLTACGSSSRGGGAKNDSSAPPATELTNAVRALGQGHALTISFGLGASTADILKLGTDDNGVDGPTPQEAQVLANDRIVFEFVAPVGKTLAEAGTAAATAFRLESPSGTYASFLVVNKSLYAQANVRYFYSVDGALDQYRTLLRNAASFPPFARAAIEGKWVSLPNSTLKAFEGFLKGASGATPPTPAPSQIRALESTALSTLLTDLQVARTSTGTTDHLTLTSNIRTLLRDEYTAVFPKLTALSASLNAIPLPHFDLIPNRTVTLDADITGGALSTVSLDVGQFDKTIPFRLPITVTFTRSGDPITAPATATPIDFSQIAQLFEVAPTNDS
jgi:hypothetical protein